MVEIGIDKQRLKPQNYQFWNEYPDGNFFSEIDSFSGVILKPQEDREEGEEEEQKMKRFEFIKVYPALYPEMTEMGKYEVKPESFKVFRAQRRRK